MDRKNVGIVGATGYVGEELLSILDNHERANISFVSSHNGKGKMLYEITKEFSNIENLKLDSIENIKNYDLDIVFFATKHNFSMNHVPFLLEKGIKVIDLSADFRFNDPNIWENAYGEKHKAPELLKKSIYGLPEFNAEKIKDSDLIAVPGCYPTASLLGILPLIDHIKPESKIILDVKSGISGAGRNAVENSLENDLQNNFKAYSPEFHRHQPEIKNFLSSKKGTVNEIIFTPHLLPIFRGEYITAYLELNDMQEDLNQLFENHYSSNKFVRILNKGTIPELSKVQNTNFCDIAIFKNQGCTVIHSAIDNLVKGAAGQAIQCFNLMIGEKEEYILE